MGFVSGAVSMVLSSPSLSHQVVSPSAYLLFYQRRNEAQQRGDEVVQVLQQGS